MRRPHRRHCRRRCRRRCSYCRPINHSRPESDWRIVRRSLRARYDFRWVFCLRARTIFARRASSILVIIIVALNIGARERSIRSALACPLGRARTHGLRVHRVAVTFVHSSSSSSEAVMSHGQVREFGRQLCATHIVWQAAETDSSTAQNQTYWVVNE